MAVAETITRDYALKNNMTPNGKSIRYEKLRGGGLLCIKFDGGGELPSELSGQYTNPATAQAAITSYLRTKWDAHEAKVQEKVSGKAA